MLVLRVLLLVTVLRAFGFRAVTSFVPRRILTRYRHVVPAKAKLHAASSPINYEKAVGARVVVVGGGVGGLSVAARIASACPFCEVKVIEKNSEVGGRSGSFAVNIPSLGTFRHERGPSLLLLPHIYRELFQDCSKSTTKLSTPNPEDYGLVMQQCIPAYQVVFDDGDRLDVGFGPNAEGTEQQLASKAKMDSYEPSGSEKWDEYMDAMSAYLNCGLPNFIEERLDLLSFPEFLREALRGFGKAWPLKPHSDVLDASFESDKMRALASFQDLYVGLEPYRNDDKLFGGVLQTTAPAVFGLLAAIELHPTNQWAGVFAPQGGFRAVSNAFKNLAIVHGVSIETGKFVTRINEAGVHVCDMDDVTRQSTFEPADLIIVNADLPYATKCLFAEAVKEGDSQENLQTTFEPKYDFDDAFLYSSGVVAFRWSIDMELGDLNTHNVFLSAAFGREQAVASWNVLRSSSDLSSFVRGDKVVHPFNFYVHRPTKMDPSAAPPGCDCIMVLVPCPTLKRKEEYANLPRSEAIEKYKQQFSAEYISQLRRAVLERFAAINSLRDLESRIVDEVIDTPGTYADQYNLAAGTPFALSHGFGQLSLTRPGATFDIETPNILFCGASSRPGNGVPLVLIGSKRVAKMAVARLKDLENILRS